MIWDMEATPLQDFYINSLPCRAEDVKVFFKSEKWGILVA
jgi:hypothetical protein